MFSMKHSSKIKNHKIMQWHLELSEYLFDIHNRPGLDNVPCDTLFWACAIASTFSTASFEELLNN